MSGASLILRQIAMTSSLDENKKKVDISQKMLRFGKNRVQYVNFRLVI